MPTLPASTGIALPLSPHKTLKITNPHGPQVVDFWALNPSSPSTEYLSMAHNHAIHRTLRLTATTTPTLYSSLSNPMLSWLDDSTPDKHHDSLIAACNPLRYERLGFRPEDCHASCAGNYEGAVRGLDVLDGGKEGKGKFFELVPSTPPAPLNLFMNVGVEGEEGRIVFRKPTSREGDFVRFRALMEVVVVMSACPMDRRASEEWVPVPREVVYEVSEG